MINNITIKQTYIDISDFLAKLRLYLQNQEVNLADNAEGLLTEREITTKQNWKLANLLDNTEQANLVAVNGKTGLWDENWHITGSCSTNIAINIPNANNTFQQQGISLEDMQKTIQNALVQQKTKNQTLVKKVTELESQIAKQTASQTVEPVRQPKGLLFSLQTKKDSISEFGEVNNATINVLGWKANMPISIKNKNDKIVISTRNFAHINNDEPKPMLCLDMT
ncbi:16565_t:CDS:2 [Cetraspora pellucida]|uniref:16565_t:CDS:1 n=1 Tax=Cetraspora pellucida TaxID=1433469 RepID=A0A9N9NR80_9GLOM|nr:16565_t:CDS:2 [Cetraspora pellucida]